MTKKTLTVRNDRLSSSLSSLESYIYTAYRYPVLSVEEERKFALSLHDEGDLLAARSLVLHNLRFVIQVARGYNGYGLALGDLVQEGNIGLMKAIKRFDPSVGVRLISFAVHWIRAEIHEFILKNWRIVKIATTKAQRKLFFNLRKSKQHLGWYTPSEVEKVADKLNVRNKDVLEMEMRLSNYDVAFDAPATDGEENNYTSPDCYLQASSLSPEDELIQSDLSSRHSAMLQQGMAKLDERSRDIVVRRWINENKASLRELAAKYGISAERIRQIENSAIKRLRSSFLAA